MISRRTGWKRRALAMAMLVAGVIPCGAWAEETPKGSSISEWNMSIKPRGLVQPVAPGRFLTEVYDPEVGWASYTTLLPGDAVLSPDPEPPRTNDPLFFRFTDFELDLSFTGYLSWDRPSSGYFTYPVSEEWRGFISIDTTVNPGCDEDFVYLCSVYSEYAVSDTLATPSYYIRRFRQYESLNGYFRLDFLPDNNKFPRAPWIRPYANMQLTSQFSFVDPEVLTNCSQSPGKVCESLSVGGVVYTKVLEGYTTSTLVTRYDPCFVTKIDILHAPASIDAISPSDVIPPGFPFPAPDDFITMAVEDMLIAKGNPVGFLERSVRPRGPVYSTASLSSTAVGEPIITDVTWTLPATSSFAGTTITLPLSITGGVEHTGAVSLAVRLQSPVSFPHGNVTATQAPGISDADFRDRLRVIDDRTLEYRCLATGDFSTVGNTTVASLRVVLPSGLSPGDRIELVPVQVPVDNVLPTSMVDTGNRPVVNSTCEDGGCQIKATPGAIVIIDGVPGPETWSILGVGGGVRR